MPIDDYRQQDAIKLVYVISRAIPKNAMVLGSIWERYNECKKTCGALKQWIVKRLAVLGE